MPKRTLNVSIVVYGHQVKDIYTVIHSLFLSARFANVSKLYLTLIDNKGDFLYEELMSIIEEMDFSEKYKLSYVIRSDNPGYGVSNNLAIHESKELYYLILNPDVIFQENSLNEALSYMEKCESCILTSPEIRNEYNAVVSGIKRYPSLLVLFVRFVDIKLLNFLFKRKLDEYTCQDIIDNAKPSKVDIVSGCCMLFKNSSLLQIGGFSDKYFLYFEDFDLSLRASKIGDLYYVPNFKIKHFGGNTGRKGVKHIKCFLSSMIKFFCDYKIKVF
ncbi:glycosyltransferase family 2 protein [Vibrio spartinae]|uniref:N-acetylglucosaminyl-diphospho-decaprenol L-rhamnosyltransferase n=1 Tax=Vibrio spartinae TaxID=1918945 RepID=A0A1N6M2N8_9VIBR|nr:glycosyltransferase family 2 protein [Vibrio spartinae]SIO93713.1 N-acetylglucosaminyl-diphospho-decaprenol L-rhamnosyltransferase [Vibrio spartinae]